MASSAVAKVAVLANRTVSAITVEIQRLGELPQNLTIPSGDSQPVFFASSLQVRFGESLQRQQYPLRAGAAYFFSRGADGQRLQLEQIGLGEQATSEVPPDMFNGKEVPDSVTIPVKLLVDENEPTHRRIWEPKLRQRIADASQILHRQSGLRLQVVEVATWDSDEREQNFARTLLEFERKVKPHPAQLAIGFSSQYQASRGRSHLGVTRWPLHTHILLRERSRDLLESEKLELLVHELGHYLGGSHSPEPQSVMRPLLTRGQQRGVGSRIQFDPVNALLIALVGEEVRRYGLKDVRKLSKPTIERLRQIYGVLKLAMPNDPAARQYLRILDLMTAAKNRKKVINSKPQTDAPLVRDTRKILTQLLIAAHQQQNDQDATELASEAVTGDELTNFYVRQAALAASRLRSTNKERAMLLALGIFLDDTETLRTFPATSSFIRSVETEEQRSERVGVLGNPTMQERSDLTKHFFVSAHLFVVGGKEVAASAGLAKEMLDAQGGTGFSFVDMAANRAGIVFAEHVQTKQFSLAKLARTFHVDDYLPTLRGLKEGLTAQELQNGYGGGDQPTSDKQPSIDEQLDAIEQRVLSLPVYDQAE
ncbi:MAG: M12 family metallo-peptidase [Bythopirellula sp.]